MSQTTDKMREIAGTIARKITEQGKKFGVDECVVDDFNRFGKFSLICYLDFYKQNSRGYFPNNRASFKMRKIVDLIKSVIREYKNDGAIFQSHECPEGIYYSAYGQKSFDGYERRYIAIDLDFIPYRSATNVFTTQKVVGSDVDPNQLAMEL
jgi:hypothetical protein